MGNVRCCCDFTPNTAYTRCDILKTSKCKDVDIDGLNLTWVKAKAVQGMFGSRRVEKRLNHFRHNGKCVVPIGLVRGYYKDFPALSPDAYCPPLNGEDLPSPSNNDVVAKLKRTHVRFIWRAELNRPVDVECEAGYKLANKPKCYYHSPTRGTIFPWPLCLPEVNAADAV